MASRWQQWTARSGRAAVTGSYASVATPSDPPRSSAMLIRSFKSLLSAHCTRRLSASCLRCLNSSTPLAFHVTRTPTSTMQINYFLVRRSASINYPGCRCCNLIGLVYYGRTDGHRMFSIYTIFCAWLLGYRNTLTCSLVHCIYSQDTLQNEYLWGVRIPQVLATRRAHQNSEQQCNKLIMTEYDKTPIERQTL